MKELTPEEAGTISGEGTIGTVEWTENWEGIASIKVKGINDNCGEGEFSEAFEVECNNCTGITSYSSIEKINLFPNPTNGELFLKYNGQLMNTEISVINSLNQLIYQKTISFTDKGTFSIDLSDQANGVYFLKMKSDSGERIEKIILK